MRGRLVIGRRSVQFAGEHQALKSVDVLQERIHSAVGRVIERYIREMHPKVHAQILQNDCEPRIVISLGVKPSREPQATGKLIWLRSRPAGYLAQLVAQAPHGCLTHGPAARLGRRS